jgi:hypothetical protein
MTNFDAFGVQLRRGRGFTVADDAEAVPVAIVNEAFVRRYIPSGDDAIGRRSSPLRPPPASDTCSCRER